MALSELSFVASMKTWSLTYSFEGKGAITYWSKSVLDFFHMDSTWLWVDTFVFITNVKCYVEIKIKGG